MSDSEQGNGDAGGRLRVSDEVIGRKLRDVLVAAGELSGTEARPDEPWELGRLVRAFVRLDDAGVRSEVIALVEAIGQLRSETDPFARR